MKLVHQTSLLLVVTTVIQKLSLENCAVGEWLQKMQTIINTKFQFYCELQMIFKIYDCLSVVKGQSDYGCNIRVVARIGLSIDIHTCMSVV